MTTPTPLPSTPDRARGRAARSVLVVDDDRDIRETLQEVLELEGYEVTTARNGLEALARMRAERPAIVLLDLFMPVMDGLEFRRRQLEEAELAEVPVVVVSAAAGVEDRIASLGVAGHLEKPLRIESLFEVMERHCK
ncbi:MAG TPA: response regulator [Anaeromyxobacteraceae bacterium]|nr:response regulator [Anaeromyxobacteraceae bacterium]